MNRFVSCVYGISSMVLGSVVASLGQNWYNNTWTRQDTAFAYVILISTALCGSFYGAAAYNDRNRVKF